MKTFAEIHALALARHGAEALAAALPQPPAVPLAAQTDDRVLAEFARRIFQTGLSWQLVERKWPAFETAFHGFDPARNAMMSEDDLDRLLADAGIIRHAAKILAVRDNAVLLTELAREHGSAAAFLAAWPSSDAAGLYDLLQTRGARLGGLTGPYALRQLGYDGFLLSKSVLAGLAMAGVLAGPTTSKAARARIQAAFNAWATESGLRHAVISRTLAMAVPD